MKKMINLKKDEIKSNYSDGQSRDLVIIGAGITGLTTGLMWLKNTHDKKTLIIDKNSYPGGYITAYQRGDYVFETTQLFPDVIDILDYLDIDLNLREFEGTYMRSLVVRGDEVDEYRIPVGPHNFAEYLMELFPEDAKKVKKFIDYCIDLFSQVRKLKAFPNLKDMIVTPFVAPKVLVNLNRSYSDLLDKFGFTNLKLREVLETFNAFSGLPPDQTSSIIATGAMMASMTKSFRTWGYFDEFPATMSKLFQERGGEMRLSAPVEEIVVKDGKAIGVKIAGDDSVIRADKVVTTIDPMVAMRGLVGDEHLPKKYVKRLDNTLMSPSSFNVALGLDDGVDLKELDLDYPFNVISTGLGSMEKLYDGFLNGVNNISKDCFHAAVVCPSLTTGAKNTITINVVPVAMENWNEWRKNDKKRYREEKEKLGDFFIDIVEKHFIPELSRCVVQKDISTPATYARYSGSPTGSIFDMATTVDQFGPRRLPMKTPIENLFQPKFAYGIYGAMVNGLQVTDLMLNCTVNDGNSLLNPR